MTIQDLKTYFKKHYCLIFKYQSKYYSLVRSRSLFGDHYSLIATDAFYQQRDSIEELCEQIYICKDTLLIEAVKNIEIPKGDDSSWETYEAVRHSAIVHKNEIHFLYDQRDYWIVHTREGLSQLCDDLGDSQSFTSCKDLFEYARIGGKSLKDIWDEVIVDSC